MSYAGAPAGAAGVRRKKYQIAPPATTVPLMTAGQNQVCSITDSAVLPPPDSVVGAAAAGIETGIGGGV